MVSLTDITPSVRTVSIRGAEVQVPGVSIKGITYLLSKFPQVQALLEGKDVALDAAFVMDVAPDAMAAIIAAGTGSPGDPAAESVAASLTLGEQLDLVEAILEVTMPQGIHPFVERLTALTRAVGGSDSEEPTKEQGSNSRSRQKK